jgi:endonuclease-3
MPRESARAKKARLQQICQGLAAAYPDAHCELNYSSPFQLLIATILSAQSTDKQVNIITEKLFQKYRAPKDFATAPIAELEQDLKAIGLFRNKAKNIKACCQQLVDAHHAEVPRRMSDLTGLSGVGRKTANVVLGNAFNISEGIVVDTHVARLSGRLGLTAELKPEKIEQALQKLLPAEQWTLFSHWLIWHGRRRCFARSPDCPNCEVLSSCPTGRIVAS